MLERRDIECSRRHHRGHVFALSGCEPDRALQADPIGHQPEGIQRYRLPHPADRGGATTAAQSVQGPHEGICARPRREAVKRAIDAVALGHTYFGLAAVQYGQEKYADSLPWLDKAIATLTITRKAISHDIAKVLRSAIANAQQKEGFGGDIDRLFVSACYADQGPSMKRIRPAPMGRAFRVVKRTAHLTVRVAERPVKIVASTVPPAKTRARAKSPAGAGAAAPARKQSATGKKASKTKK